MLSGSEDAWHSAHLQARGLLLSDPAMLSALDEIHDDPVYYSAWKTREIPGNLFCQGSTSAEQNHSSSVAHMGGGGSLSIAEHISRLTEWQAQFHKTRNSLAATFRLNQQAYKSKRPGKFGTNDVVARRSLSGYGFGLYSTEARAPLIFEKNVDKSIEFWLASTPREERRECNYYLFWDSGHEERCPCSRRVAYTM
jgi:hypothetical protein